MEATERVDNQMEAAEWVDDDQIEANAAEFVVHCQTLLDDKNAGEVLKLLQDDVNTQSLKEVGWEIVSLLCKHLNDNRGENRIEEGEEEGEAKEDDDDDDDDDVIEKCLQQLVKRCSTKEMILGLSEHIASECSVKSFTIAMQLCKQSMVLLQRRQSKYLENICDHAVTKIKTLLQKQQQQQQLSENVDKESKDKNIVMLLSCVIDLLNGMTTQVRRVKSEKLESFLAENTTSLWPCNEIFTCRDVLVKFVFNVIEVFAEWEVFADPWFAEYEYLLAELVALTFKFISFPDFLYNLQYRSCTYNSTGIVVFVYLLFVKHCWEIPIVYTYQHIFHLSSTYISPTLYTGVASPQTNKIALALLATFLERIINESLSHDILVSLKGIGEGLTKMMIWSQDQVTRKESQDAFLLLLQKMKFNSQYLLLEHIYNVSDHSGLLGYIIGRINTTVEQLCKYNDESVEINVGELSLLFTNIEVGKNNILHESDRYISALSFVRFWLLRDISHPDRGVWARLPEVNKNISVMSTCIDFSKKEFEQQLQEIDKPEKKIEFHTEMLLSLPGGEAFPELSSNEKKDIVNKALLTLDMMACVIARIHEITSEKHQDHT